MNRGQDVCGCVIICGYKADGIECFSSCMISIEVIASVLLKLQCSYESLGDPVKMWIMIQ